MIYGKMITVASDKSLDASADSRDRVTVEIQRNVANYDQRTIYIHVNGVTIVRIGHIEHDNLDVIFQEGLGK